MNFTAIIIICVLIIMAVITTAVSRCRESHSDEDLGMHVPDENYRKPSDPWNAGADEPSHVRHSEVSLKDASRANEKKARSYAKKQKQKGSGKQGKKRDSAAPSHKSFSADAHGTEKRTSRGSGQVAAAAIGIIIAAALVVIPLVNYLSKRAPVSRNTSTRPSESTQAVIDDITSQLSDEFPLVEADDESDYANSIGFGITAYLSDGDGRYRNGYVQIFISKTGVIQTVDYTGFLDHNADKAAALEDIQNDFNEIHDKISGIDAEWSSGNLKNDPAITDKVRNFLLSYNESDSASGSDYISDETDYDDGCMMHCMGGGGDFVDLMFSKYVSSGDN